ncbi:Uma2 family endonuclease [Stratiformator vulcanicus]|uniref:Putative restriction endonuclease domain-containing protein n=1 Tax=Stratiformator vulcanicus TaxID=2527980 RepID=A0A517R1K7_9PLAN|nr:Uma2 family endonuclease [Stratiformator vulcanicus]QDT37741.1 hypothetical protein Pan189_21230 [Stratiformator vulcanicus]
MSTDTAAKKPITAQNHPILDRADRGPLLQNGDRMDADEFMRRYEASPGLKAELIDGRVYVASPVRNSRHSVPNSSFTWWVTHYAIHTPGVEPGTNGTVVLEDDNLTQPDALLRILKSSGGQSDESDEDYIENAPELVCEIAASSVNYDLHDKLELYCRSGVKEYIVWRVEDGEIDWFAGNEGRFEKQQPGEDGLYYSQAFPGLWLDAKAMLSGDLKTVLVKLQTGINAPEHEKFVERLESTAGERKA